MIRQPIRSTRTERGILILSLTVCLASPVVFALAALGSKWGWWDWRFGLGIMTRDWGPPLAWCGMALAVITALLWFRREPRWGSWTALALAALPAAMLGGLRYQQSKVLELPAIYDVQTDWDNPIRFSEQALLARNTSDRVNLIEDDTIVIDDGRRGKWAGMKFRDAQELGYPDLKPLTVEMGSDLALSRAKRALTRNGLAIERTISSEGVVVIEGYARTPWYGLIDDYALRIQSVSPVQSRIDMRSVSREGHIDLGINAKRIETVLSEIQS